MATPSSLVCDVCSHSLRAGSGYILRTGDVVSAPRYWERNFKSIEEMGGKVNVPLVLQSVRSLSEKHSPWIICDGCIDLFDADRSTARRLAMKYWSSGETPEGGPGDHDAALRAALTAFGKLDRGGFPLEWPRR